MEQTPISGPPQRWRLEREFRRCFRENQIFLDTDVGATIDGLTRRLFELRVDLATLDRDMPLDPSDEGGAHSFLDQALDVVHKEIPRVRGELEARFRLMLEQEPVTPKLENAAGLPSSTSTPGRNR